MSTPWWRHEVLGNYIVLGPLLLTLVLVFPLAIAIEFAHADPAAAAVANLLLYAGGLSFFLIAKLSLIRRGIRVSFGSRNMSPGHRRLYRLGYLMMFAAALLTVAILAAVGQEP